MIPTITHSKFKSLPPPERAQVSRAIRAGRVLMISHHKERETRYTRYSATINDWPYQHPACGLKIARGASGNDTRERGVGRHDHTDPV
jgi:hypothetical protein